MSSEHAQAPAPQTAPPPRPARNPSRKSTADCVDFLTRDASPAPAEPAPATEEPIAPPHVAPPSSRPASIHSTASTASRRKAPPPTEGLEDVVAAEAAREAAYQAARRAAANAIPEMREVCVDREACPPLRHKPSSMNLAAGYRC
ncbi:hypothetical protein PsYK624_116930 [Phanerochaete sordida]|uniref:Uncharacterized protein n=1 Tax=Phanerochaete sordida TaxID=48140 RepID=A0A9P3GGD1_9APHY|nr:hypothetical protein PsYK624_116930 [Phanerochaete sordida]